jgi:hypothetical protein
MNPKKILLGLLHSKFGKLLPVLLIAGLTATASAAVFVMYYGNATATVQTADVSLVAGSDAPGSSCSTNPCASATIASTGDFATIGISLYASATNTPQPATYYTDLLRVHNGASSVSHAINSVTISNIVGASNLGSITIYYCSTQTNTPATSSSCDSFSITSSTGGSLSGNSVLPATLAHGASGYIEAVVSAASTATVSSTVTFQIAISWA